MKRPNILIVNYNLGIIGGAETVTVNLANELAILNKYNVFLLSLNTSQNMTPYILNQHISFCQWNDTGSRFIITLIKRRKEFRQYIEDNHIDLVISVSIAAIFSAFIHNKNIKTIACDHTGLMNQKNENIKAFIIKWIESRTCDRYVVLNDIIKDEFIKLFKINNSKIVVIPNWLTSSISKDYNSDSKKIVSIGRLSKEKGYDLLCEVATILSAKYPDWHWDIYGDGAYRMELVERIEDRKLQGFISLKGMVKNAASLLPHYSMLVLTSYREAFPLVILEAKAKSLPVVSFDINSGPGLLIRDSLDGYLIPPFEVNEMAQKIESLISDKELRIKMSRNATGNLDEYQKNNIISRWQMLIDELLM